MKKSKKDKNPGHQYSRGLFFRNYDLYGPEEGSDISPGTGFYQHMHEYKSVKDFLDKKKKRKNKLLYPEASAYDPMEHKVKEDKFKRNASYFQKIAADILDLSGKLHAKKEEGERKQTLQELSESLSTPSAPKEEKVVKLPDPKEREFLQEVEEVAGVWMHPFSQVHKDDEGFFILKSENPSGHKMGVGQLIADYAINMTPYWSIKSIHGNRINLEPIGSNPFKSGVGAGGAKITSYDVNVFTGKYEEERRNKALAALNSGNADIDDVKYLLLGTCPVRMGPNGAEGGWYNPRDTYSNRGGRLGLSESQIIQKDAQQLKEWGFDVPKKALEGTISDSAWKSWIEAHPEKRELEQYQYDDNADTVEDLKNKILSAKDRRANRMAIIKLMDMIDNGEASDEVLKDIIKAGGSPDYMCNEKIIYHFALKKDVDTLKLCLEKLNDTDNKKLCYIRLIELDPSSGEDLLKKENDIGGLYQGFSDLKHINEVKGHFGELKNSWAVNFIKENNLVDKVKNAVNKPSLSYSEKSTAHDFLSSMLSAFGNPYFWTRPDPKFPELQITEDEIALYKKIEELYNQVKNIKISSRKFFLRKIASS